MPARIRIPTYAVWETVVFALNILAFIFIGLQIRPILESLEPAERGRYFAVAGAVLVTVIVVRLAWHMSFNAVVRWRDRRFGFHPPRPMLRPTVGSGLVISWAGMRGIVSLAAALALPAAFPYRDLIVLTAFAVVLGTLVIQGLTLKPLLRALDLHDDDPVGREAGGGARARAASRAGELCATTDSPVADAVRQEFTRAPGTRQTRMPEAGAARAIRHTASSTAEPSTRRGRRFSPCAPTTRSATTRSTRSKRNWTGSRWRVAETRGRPQFPKDSSTRCREND